MCSVGYAQDDALVGAVLGGELRPDGGELVVGRATLSDDLTVPACVVVLCDQVSASYHLSVGVKRTRSTMTKVLEPELSAAWTVLS